MGLEVMTIIPARGGSKGIPQKNLRLLAGKPLISYTIKQSLNSSLVNRTFVSTDSLAIKEVSEKCGAEVIVRPSSLAKDKTTSEAAVRHAIKYLERKGGYLPDIIVFLQCTSPLRRKNDIDRAIKYLLKNKYDSIFSAYEKHYMVWEENRGKLRSLNFDYRKRPRRQDKNKEYVENGSIFIFKRNSFLTYGNRICGKAGVYVMPYEYSIDIDDLFDFWLCKKLINRRRLDD